MHKRMFDIDIWDKKWFSKLANNYKLFWYFLLSRCDEIGVWDVNEENAEFFMNEKLDWRTVKEIFKDQIEIIRQNKWLIKDFIKFQYGADLKNNKMLSKIKKLLIHHKIILSESEFSLDFLSKSEFFRESISDKNPPSEIVDPPSATTDGVKDKDKDINKNIDLDLIDLEKKDIDLEKKDIDLKIANSVPEKIDNPLSQYQTIFETFRKKYPGTKRGLDTEFEYFQKTAKDWKEVLDKLLPAIEQQITIQTQNRVNTGGTIFWKNLKTWINNRGWEEEIALMQPKQKPKEVVPGCETDANGTFITKPGECPTDVNIYNVRRF